MKFGKLPAIQDSRTIRYRALLPKDIPVAPPQFDVDFDRPDVWPLPMPMFANDQWGDCVIAGRANWFMRAEKIEQDKLIEPTDNEVLAQYWREQGDFVGKEKPDNGLSMLESLKSWRSNGWVVGGRRYDIYAFAEINKFKMPEVMSAIYLLTGLLVGVVLRQGDMDALEKQQVWDISQNAGAFVGGHCMYAVGYTLSGLVFLTWGQRQVATWPWVLDRVDEIYGIVDNRDNFFKSSLDINTLDAYLKIVTR